MKMRATAKMPRGVLQRYRTRMMAADGDTFEEPARRWQQFYTTQGWASEVRDEPAPSAPRRRGRPPKNRTPETEPAAPATADAQPEPQAEPQQASDPFEHKTVSELREMAEQRGVELQSGYVPRDELIEKLRGGAQSEVDE